MAIEGLPDFPFEEEPSGPAFDENIKHELLDAAGEADPEKKRLMIEQAYRECYLTGVPTEEIDAFYDLLAESGSVPPRAFREDDGQISQLWPHPHVRYHSEMHRPPEDQDE